MFDFSRCTLLPFCCWREYLLSGESTLSTLLVPGSLTFDCCVHMGCLIRLVTGTTRIPVHFPPLPPPPPSDQYHEPTHPPTHRPGAHGFIFKAVELPQSSSLYLERDDYCSSWQHPHDTQPGQAKVWCIASSRMRCQRSVATGFSAWLPLPPASPHFGVLGHGLNPKVTQYVNIPPAPLASPMLWSPSPRATHHVAAVRLCRENAAAQPVGA